MEVSEENRSSSVCKWRNWNLKCFSDFAKDFTTRLYSQKNPTALTKIWGYFVLDITQIFQVSI